MVKESKNGLVFLRNGKIVHAETNSLRGRDALFEIVAWKYVEFAYESRVRPPLETIDTPWHEILIGVINRNKKEEARPQRQSA